MHILIGCLNGSDIRARAHLNSGRPLRYVACIWEEVELEEAAIQTNGVFIAGGGL